VTDEISDDWKNTYDRFKLKNETDPTGDPTLAGSAAYAIALVAQLDRAGPL
jgi:hypothetical protein